MRARGEEIREPLAAAGQRFVDQQVAVECQDVEDDVRNRHLRTQRLVDDFALETRLEGAKGLHAFIADRDDLAVEDRIPRERRKRRCHFGIGGSHVVEPA